MGRNSSPSGGLSSPGLALSSPDAAGEAERHSALPAGHQHHPRRGADHEHLALRGQLRPEREPGPQHPQDLQRRLALPPLPPHLLAPLPPLCGAMPSAQPGHEVHLRGLGWALRGTRGWGGDWGGRTCPREVWVPRRSPKSPQWEQVAQGLPGSQLGHSGYCFLSRGKERGT